MTTTGFPNLFSPLRIGGITLKNRIVSTGHETAMADENGINEAIVAYHEARAKGGAGLIIVEVALVHDAAVFTVNPIKVTSDDCIPRYRRLAEVVQRHDCLLFGQLFHPGREIIDSLDGSAPVSFAPSAVPNERFHVMPKPMSRDDIARVVAGFGDGARRLREAGLDFIIQTTLTSFNRDEIADLVAWSVEQGAVSFNLYFLVQTGRGSGMQGLSPEENDTVLRELVRLQKEYRGRMLVRSKCQPQLMRHVHELDPQSPLMSYSTRCPCGIQYCRITPDGKLTPCPYLPAEAGDLRKQSFAEIWNDSELFRQLRSGGLGGKCGDCEYRRVCGGCRARAYADSGGDVMAPDESCSYEPSADTPIVVIPQITYGGAPAELELEWTPEAEARMARIPSFVRNVVMQRVEDFARREGHSRITPEVLDNVRKGMPVDFSKKLPFFLRKGKP